jgi:histidine phosphotransferase ChpT
MSQPDLAALLCSRLCHDLVSPIGALTNGVELLADENDPSMQEQCLTLLADSARQAANKLKFFRLAFGSGGSFGSDVDVREVRDAVSGLFPAEKVTLQWLVMAPVLPKSAVKVLLNMALLTGESLLRGGTLSLAADMQGRDVELAAKAEGPRVLLPEDLRSVLGEGPNPETLDSRLAPAALIHGLVRDCGGSVQVAQSGADAPLVVAARMAC